jgi:AIPR protein
MKVLTLNGVREGRRQSDPLNPNRYVLTGLVPVEEVQKFAKDGGMTPWANPRLTSPNGKMAKVIRYSLINERGKFHDLNRGPALVADLGKLDKDTVVANFAPGKKRGLIDGGTTVSAIIEELSNGFQQSDDQEKQQLVNVRIFCGPRTETEVDELVEALNTNKQVDAISLANFQGDFEWIKEVLKSKRFPLKVSYFDGDTGEYEIDDIVQILSLFVMAEPTDAYLSKQACLQNFQANPDLYKCFGLVLTDILHMSEYIPLIVAEKYKQGGGKFAALEMIGGDKSKKEPKYTFPLLNKTVNFTPRNAWVFPILASLKANLGIDKDGNFMWKVSPTSLVDEVARDLFDKVKNAFDREKNLNYGVGRNADLYENLGMKVEKAIERLSVNSRATRKIAGAA